MKTFWPNFAYKISEDGKELTFSQNGKKVTYKLLDGNNKKIAEIASDGNSTTVNNAAPQKGKNGVWHEQNQWHFKFYWKESDSITFKFFNDYAIIDTLNDGKYMWKQNKYFEYDDKAKAIQGEGSSNFNNAVRIRTARVQEEMACGLQKAMTVRCDDTANRSDDDDSDDESSDVWSD